MIKAGTAQEHGAIKAGDKLIDELSLGGTLTNWEETIDVDTRITGSILRDPLTTIVGDQKPAEDVMPRAKFRVGDSYVTSKAKHCNFKGDECWNVRVQPVIDSIEPAVGSVIGGQELTITGFGLDG